MNASIPVFLMAAMAASGEAKAADQIYSSAQAEPGLQVRSVRGCVYLGQMFSQGAVLQAGTGIVLKCVPTAALADDEREGRYAAPVWASLLLENKAPQRQRK